MAFDVEGARKAGYSDAEIADFLAGQAKVDAASARKSGYSDAELISQLAPSTGGAAQQSYTDPEGLGRGVPPHSQASQATAAAVGRIGQAAAEGYEAGAPDVTPGLLMSPVNYGLAALPGAANALYRGLQQTGVEMISPLLGSTAARDIVSIPDAFMGSPHMTSVPGRPPIPGTELPVRGTQQTVPFMHGPSPSAVVAPPAPPGQWSGGVYNPEWVGRPGTVKLSDVTQAVRDAPSSAPEQWRPVAPGEDYQPGREYRMNQTTGRREVNVGGAGPAAPRGVTEPEAGVTQPAGAQVTPSAQATLTPEQAAEYGSTADKQWLYKSKPPGEVDNTEYIAGIKPTMAQREQTAVRARETKDLRNLSPEAAQAERELLDEHNTKRKADLAEVAGSDVTQGNDIRAADKRINDELGAAFRKGGQVDAAPIVDAINTERNAPSGKLPPVQAVMDIVEKALQKRDGSGLETDPQQVYGARRVVNYLQSKRGISENPGYGDADVQAALIRVKQAIDKNLEPVAPGFGDAIKNYAEAQRAIEARGIIQEMESDLYDGLGRMQFSRLHKFMKDAIQARDPQAGPNPYKSINEQQWNRLKSLHDDLMRVASAEDLAKAFGSDTAQNAAGFMRKMLQGAASTLAGSAVGTAVTALTGPVTGTIAGGTTAAGVQRLFGRRAQARAATEMNQLLRPDQTLYPTRPNELLGPGP